MQNLTDALLISALGMGLVFGAIALLWVVMVLLMRFLPERETAGQGPAGEALPGGSGPRSRDTETVQRAAAAALAVALALEQDRGGKSRALARPRVQSVPLAGTVSGWQAVTRGNQINHRRPVR